MIINQSNTNYIAHVRTSDKCKQTVATHLLEVASITKKLAAKINIPEAGELIGLLHDFGKYSASFQNYLQSAQDYLMRTLMMTMLMPLHLKAK